MQEQPTVKDLVQLLRSRENSSDKDIVDILCSIIQSHMMYGGSLADSIVYRVEEVKRLNP